MAYKRLIIYAAILAICYLVGVTWAESSAQTLQSNNSAQLSATPNVGIKSTVAAPKISQGGAANSSNAAPECECAGALLPRADNNGKDLPICPECKCAHVARNTTLIKVVVIIVIWIISILVIYMLFLMCLDPLLNKRVAKANYQEHTNEDDEPTPPMPAGPNNLDQELSARANVLNRVGHQQDKWKRQVREQRRHIYDRHTMLN